MDAINYSNFEKQPKYYFKKVNEDHEPLIVTTQDPENNVVVLSKAEYDSLIETLSIQSNSYLMDKINIGRKEIKKTPSREIRHAIEIRKEWFDRYEN